MRAVIADDSVLLREGLSRLLGEAGIEVCALVGDADALAAAVDEHRPDLAVVDIRMPPTFTHEGAQAAARLRERWPELGILLLSQSLESRYAADLARDHPARFGYLLKDRVLNVATLIDTVERIANGGTVLDPDVVSHLLGRREHREQVSALSQRERDVLGIMAEGRSNRAIADELFVNEKTVDSHISAIFTKLGLLPQHEDHRRVLAVLTWLQAPADQPPVGIVGPATTGAAFATILFADIADSTANAARLGDRRWTRLLDSFDRLCGHQLERHHGTKVNPTGDGFVATFQLPTSALHCALAIRDGALDLGLQTRAGIHVGEIERRGSDISGVAVHIAARIAALANPGEVRLSRTTSDLAAGSGIPFADAGTHDLRGVPGEWQLFVVDR